MPAEDLFVTPESVAVRLTTFEGGLVVHAWHREGVFASFHLRLTRAEAFILADALRTAIEEDPRPVRPVSIEPVMAIVRPLHGRPRVVRLEPELPVVTRLDHPKEGA